MYRDEQIKPSITFEVRLKNELVSAILEARSEDEAKEFFMEGLRDLDITRDLVAYPIDR